MQILAPFRAKILQFIGLLLGVLAVQWLIAYPEWVHRLYTERVFIWMTRPLRWISGTFQLALGELVYIILLIVLIINSIKYFISNKYSIKNGQFWISLALSLSIVLAQLYLWFMFIWGFNYYQPDPSETFHLKVKKGYSLAEVDSLSVQLIREMNQSRLQISDSQIHQYAILQESASIKKALFPSWGDKLGYLAFYQPITGEAIIRDDLPQLLKPFTLEHEKAHQKGYASETEANFIAFMAAQASKDPLLQYSTQIQIFSYAQNATLWLVAEKGDYALWKKIVERNKSLVSPKVLADRQKIKSFFAARQNERIPGSDKLYDQFLQWNNQAKGLESYDDVIRWVLAYNATKTDSSTSYSR
jgi:hypothetical protein